ncbi:MAG: class I SAM-dependent methyltransferase [Patescibacteria group bacterium]|nr:class I SAM-dependent methyltransferase [Patescibacteria group bacterium]
MDLKATYNKIAKDWFNDHKESDWWNESADIFLNLLKPGGKVLDVGCGAGLKTKYLLEQGFDVFGIDFSEEMIKLAKEHCPGAHFFVEDINQPLGLGMFDGIFAQAVLLHIPKAEVMKVLKNLYEHLNKPGYLYVVVKELRPGAKDEQNIVESDYNYEYERFFSFFTMPELEGYFEQLGLTVVHEAVFARTDNWLVIIGKK